MFLSFSVARGEAQVANLDTGNKGEEGLPLSFEGLLLIVGGGPVDLETLKGLHGKGAGLVAADGGANWCAEAGIVPDAIIGDMDSLENRVRWAAKTRLIEVSEQDSTDFEKCLYSTSSPLVLGLGLTGGRLDHTLSALDVAARCAGKRQIILTGETDVVVVAKGDFSFAATQGARVSIHPVVPVRFLRSPGLDFALDGVVLAPGKRSGTSNRATTGAFEIVPTEADKTTPYLVIMAKENLKKLLEKY